jgi:hypothetical protein
MNQSCRSTNPLRPLRCACSLDGRCHHGSKRCGDGLAKRKRSFLVLSLCLSRSFRLDIARQLNLKCKRQRERENKRVGKKVKFEVRGGVASHSLVVAAQEQQGSDEAIQVVYPACHDRMCTLLSWPLMNSKAAMERYKSSILSVTTADMCHTVTEDPITTAWA